MMAIDDNVIVGIEFLMCAAGHVAHRDQRRAFDLGGLEFPWFADVEQSRAVPAQVPAVQTSVTVQNLPSLQGVASGLVGFEQTPVVVSQVPTEWHSGSRAVQTTGFAPTHAPA